MTNFVKCVLDLVDEEAQRDVSSPIRLILSRKLGFVFVDARLWMPSVNKLRQSRDQFPPTIFVRTTSFPLTRALAIVCNMFQQQQCQLSHWMLNRFHAFIAELHHSHHASSVHPLHTQFIMHAGVRRVLMEMAILNRMLLLMLLWQRHMPWFASRCSLRDLSEELLSNLRGLYCGVPPNHFMQLLELLPTSSSSTTTTTTTTLPRKRARTPFNKIQTKKQCVLIH